MRYFKFHCDSINISRGVYQVNPTYAFKFHCDSINIFNRKLSDWELTNFKFHCDSINMSYHYPFYD